MDIFVISVCVARARSRAGEETGGCVDRVRVGRAGSEKIWGSSADARLGVRRGLGLVCARGLGLLYAYKPRVYVYVSTGGITALGAL